MTLFPFLQFTYSNIYYEFFGSFEKRMNRALRGRPAEEEQQQPAGQRGAAGHAQPEGQAQERDEGLWATVWGLGQAVVGLFGEDEIVLEAEVRVGGGNGDELDEADEAEIEAELMALERQAVIDALDELHDEERAAQEAIEREVVEAGGEAGPPPQPEQGQAQNPPQGQAAQDQAQNNQDQAPAAEDNRANTTLTDIVNNIVTSLLYPSICFGMGELLRLTLPRNLVTRPAWGRPTGLLQERWGRSLAGGCLYVVLKDAFVLYAKYRRVQVKQNRKVRNVERRR